MGKEREILPSEAALGERQPAPGSEQVLECFGECKELIEELVLGIPRSAFGLGVVREVHDVIKALVSVAVLMNSGRHMKAQVPLPSGSIVQFAKDLQLPQPFDRSLGLRELRQILPSGRAESHEADVECAFEPWADSR